MNTATQTPIQTQTQIDDSDIAIISCDNQWQFMESDSKGIESLLLLTQDLEIETKSAYQILLSFLSANSPLNIADKKLNYSFLGYNEFLVEIINYISMNIVTLDHLILCEGENANSKYTKYVNWHQYFVDEYGVFHLYGDKYLILP